MSDLNDKDDLLNYDEDIDDKYLDEDELLRLSDEETLPTKLTSKQEELLLEESEEWVEQRLQTNTALAPPPAEPINEEATSSTTGADELKMEADEAALPTSTVSESPKPESPAKKVSPKLRTSPRIKSAATPRKQLKRDCVATKKADTVEEVNEVNSVTEEPAPATPPAEQQTNVEVGESSETCEESPITANDVAPQPDQTAFASPIKSPIVVDESRTNEMEAEASQSEQSVEPDTDKEVTSASNDDSFEVTAAELSTPETARKTRIVHTDSTSEDVLELDYRQTEGDIDEMEDKSGVDEPQKPKSDANATTPLVPSTSDISESASTEEDVYKSSPEGQQQAYGGGPHRKYGVPYYQHQGEGGFPGSQQHGYGHVPGVRPLGPGQYGQDFRPNYRGQFPRPQFGRPGQRPDYSNHNGPGMMRPMMRPGGWDGPPQRFMERGGFDPRMRMSMGPGQNSGPYRPPPYQPMPLNSGGGGGGPPMRMRPPMQQQMGGPGMMMQPGPPHGLMPRKVLINPNFKGGVEAATNQLMKDTLSSQPQFMQNRVLSDEELRRQAEEFINKNMAHVGKRRYERSPSPPPRHRSRSRSRSYSPPRRRAYSRDRDPPGGRRGGRPPYRARRDGVDDTSSKRRRSQEPAHDNNKSPDENEDEETRAYRLKIESQKAEREKILREKERRRKEAAEERLKDLQKVEEAEQAKKLTPIVVTEKKIISLKKRPAETDSDTSKTSDPDRPKSSPAAKAVPETRREERKVTTSPAVSIKNMNPHNLTDEELQLEMQLLSEEDAQDDLGPHTPPPPVPKMEQPAPVFANRRVVLKSSLATATTSTSASTTTSSSSSSTTGAGKAKAGIFDRLDRKKVSAGMNEADKRKIQRIVINNAKGE